MIIMIMNLYNKFFNFNKNINNNYKIIFMNLYNSHNK